jgi:2,3-bisphosphoglycerate-dependent phosphoglycerate mutase
VTSHPLGAGRPVFLVRHGQSEWNVRRLTQGQTMAPRLTALGRDQASRAAGELAAALDGETPALVTSDLVRAVETAEIIAAALGVGAGTHLVHDRRLREQALGTLEGRGYEETWAAAEAHDWSDPALPVAGGESLLDVHARMVAALTSLDRSRPVVVVSHGDAIRTALAWVAGHPPHQAPWVEVPNGAVFRLMGATPRCAD